MKKIILISTADRQSTEALHWCLHQSKQKELTIVTYYLASSPEDLEIGKKFIEGHERQFRMFQVPFESHCEEAPYEETCVRLSSDPEVVQMVLVQKKKKGLKKLFDGSSSDPLEGRLSCEVKIYYS